MSALEWIGALGDRDPSVAIALAAITRAAGPSDTVPFADLVMSYREAHLACYQAIGNAKEQEITGDEIREHLTGSVLPRLAIEGWILDDAAGGWDPVQPRVAWWGTEVEDRQGDLRGADRGRPSRGPADQAADAAAHLDQRAGGHPPGQELQGAAGRQRRQRPGRAGRDRRPPRSQRGGKDHDLLPYNRSDPAGRGPGRARRARPDPVADVRAGPRRDRLPGPGALDLPEDDGRGEYSGDPGDAGSRRGTSGTGSSTGCWTSCRSSTCAGAGPTA